MERDGHRVGREALELELAARRRRPSCRRSAAPNRATSKCFVPRADLLVRREADADRAVRNLRDAPSGTRPRSTISATPALLSAPSSVVPDAVTMSWPICSPSYGMSASAQHRRRDRRAARGRGRRSARWTIGFTPAPLISGDVSTWAMKPIDRHVGLRRRRRNRRHHVAVLVHRRVGEADRLQLARRDRAAARAAPACSGSVSAPSRDCVS